MTTEADTAIVIQGPERKSVALVNRAGPLSILRVLAIHAIVLRELKGDLGSDA